MGEKGVTPIFSGEDKLKAAVTLPSRLLTRERMKNKRLKDD